MDPAYITLGYTLLLLVSYVYHKKRVPEERRDALRQAVNELYQLNKNQHCFDPIGSIDKRGMDKIIEVIARCELHPEQVFETRELFKGQIVDRGF